MYILFLLYNYEGIVAVHIIPLRCIDEKVKQDIWDALRNIHIGITDDKVKEVQDYLIFKLSGRLFAYKGIRFSKASLFLIILSFNQWTNFF